MSGDRDKAQAERAARLREQIEQLQRDQASEKPKEPSSGADKLSPRDFIHRRMEELDDK
jgi:hypothetical protein